MSPEPTHFFITLTEEEAAALTEGDATIGPPKLRSALRDQLVEGNLTVKLDDGQLGRVIRTMTQGGSGPFQSRLRRAFRRPLLTMLTRD